MHRNDWVVMRVCDCDKAAAARLKELAERGGELHQALSQLMKQGLGATFEFDHEDTALLEAALGLADTAAGAILKQGGKPCSGDMR